MGTTGFIAAVRVAVRQQPMPRPPTAPPGGSEFPVAAARSYSIWITRLMGSGEIGTYVVRPPVAVRRDGSPLRPVCSNPHPQDLPADGSGRSVRRPPAPRHAATRTAWSCSWPRPTPTTPTASTRPSARSAYSSGRRRSGVLQTEEFAALRRLDALAVHSPGRRLWTWPDNLREMNQWVRRTLTDRRCRSRTYRPSRRPTASAESCATLRRRWFTWPSSCRSPPPTT